MGRTDLLADRDRDVTAAADALREAERLREVFIGKLFRLRDDDLDRAADDARRLDQRVAAASRALCGIYWDEAGGQAPAAAGGWIGLAELSTLREARRRDDEERRARRG